MMTIWEVPEPRRTSAEFTLNPLRRTHPDVAQYDTVEVTLHYNGPMLSTPEPSHWMDESACSGINDIPDILTACQRCPVARQCLMYGTSNGLTGPYGGIALISGQPSKKAVW